ncbi:MAG: GGDEF domain-containing protein [Oscillospiraceae bacterium]|nr:GGDEF domain-containing protein [Oscillospiraceae bacterium]
MQYTEQPSLKKIKQLKYSLVGGFAAIVIIAIVAVSSLAFHTTDKALKNKVSSMASSLNVQMKLNMDSYLSRMETITTLAFAAEETYKYDATDPNNDEYTALKTEKIISDKLYSLCIMGNFLDYGIVYRNNHTVGKISNGTRTMFGEKIYEDLENMIVRPRTLDGWAAGYHDNFKRIYYVKQINDNALIVISFYTAELEAVFDNPETLSDMSVRLTDQNYNILYSSEEDEVGNPLPADIVSRVREQGSATVLDDEYLVSINTCSDDWYVVCSVPTRIILEEKYQIRMLIYAAAAVAALIAALLGMVLSVRLTKPVERFVSSLDTKARTDQLTGILNKLSFEESTAHRLENEIHTIPHALILLDVDDFKGVNDNLGHAYGDQVLSSIGSMLRATFSTEDYVGRVGGDEFCVLLNTQPAEGKSYEDHVREKCDAVCESFRHHYTGDDGKYKISASIGCAVFPQHGENFQSLYKSADEALYASKHRGKDTYTIYSTEVTEDA